MPDQRAYLLRAALGFALLHPQEPELRLLHTWLDSWRGIGDVVRGMARHGWDLQLTEYDAAQWRATFFVTGQAHSIIGGTVWEKTPWGPVQRATWEALGRAATV
jgi:hypothetical protein